nr:hypothetical protein [Abalone asfa-like virus]
MLSLYRSTIIGISWIVIYLNNGTIPEFNKNLFITDINSTFLSLPNYHVQKDEKLYIIFEKSTKENLSIYINSTFVNKILLHDEIPIAQIEGENYDISEFANFQKPEPTRLLTRIFSYLPSNDTLPDEIKNQLLIKYPYPTLLPGSIPTLQQETDLLPILPLTNG